MPKRQVTNSSQRKTLCFDWSQNHRRHLKTQWHIEREQSYRYTWTCHRQTHLWKVGCKQREHAPIENIAATRWKSEEIRDPRTTGRSMPEDIKIKRSEQCTTSTSMNSQKDEEESCVKLRKVLHKTHATEASSCKDSKTIMPYISKASMLTSANLNLFRRKCATIIFYPASLSYRTHLLWRSVPFCYFRTATSPLCTQMEILLQKMYIYI